MATREQRFESIYTEHAGAVYRYGLRRSPERADDLVAEVFLVAWRRLDDVPDQAALPWLLAVARRVHANALRGERRRQALTTRLGAQPTLEGASPADSRMTEALALLHERDRELLMLIAWEGLDHASAARVLGCTRANVAVRMHRARKRLAAALAALETAPADFTHITEEAGRA